ncbi:hypothetical protein D3C73_473590 [compost metagenome]
MRLPLSGRKIELQRGFDRYPLPARAAFQPVTLARLDAARLKRHELRVEGCAGHRLAIDGNNDVATRHIHLPVENERDRIAGDCCISHEIEGDDLLHIGDGARRQDRNRVTRLDRAA